MTTFSGNKKKTLLAAVITALLTLSVYLPALKNTFVNWDDNDYVYENLHIRSLDLSFFKWAFTSFDAFNWHPLTWISHAADYAVWGLDPMGHHLTSIVLHGLNTFLVVMLITRLVRIAYKDEDNSWFNLPLTAGIVTGLLFGLHPVHVESVAWVSERNDLLCAFFFLLSIISYLRYVASSAGRNMYIFALLFFALALMSKPMAVTLPVVFIILDMYPLERLSIKKIFSKHKKVLIEKIPFFLLSIISSVLTLLAQKGAMPSLDILPFGTRAAAAMRALGFYITKMLFPVGLAPLYPHPKETSLFSTDYLFFIILAAVILISCIWAIRKKQKFWAAAWTYYLVTLVPVIGIIQVGVQAAADRYTYLPGLGPMILVGLGTALLLKKVGSIHGTNLIARGSVIVTVIAVTGILSVLTISQIKVWRDPLTLWNSQLAIYSSHIAHNNRGNIYSELQEYQKAMEDFSRAIELESRYASAYNNRGSIYSMFNEYQKAVWDFNRAIELEPEYASPLYNRGLVFRKLGQDQKAIADYSRAIELNPEYVSAYVNRGNSYSRLKEYQKAIADLSRAIELNPWHASAYYNRGIVYTRSGNYQKAITNLNKAIELNPEYVSAYKNRGMSYLKLGDKSKANKNFQQAARLGDKNSRDYLSSIGIDF